MEVRFHHDRAVGLLGVRINRNVHVRRGFHLGDQYLRIPPHRCLHGIPHHEPVPWADDVRENSRLERLRPGLEGECTAGLRSQLALRLDELLHSVPTAL